MPDEVKLLPWELSERQLSDHMAADDVERAFCRRLRDYEAWRKKCVPTRFRVEMAFGDAWVAGYLAAIAAWNTRAIEATRPPIGTDEVVERTEAEELAMIAAAFPPKPKCDADGKFRPGETLKEYFARNGTPADPEAMAEYERSMREDTIPAIERDLKAQQRAAHFLRLGIPDPAAMKDAASD